jgi:hypothetical protein
MTARVLSLTERLPPEAPVHRHQTLYIAAYTHLWVTLALDGFTPPTPSELIDELVHTANPRRRQELADAIARSAP